MAGREHDFPALVLRAAIGPMLIAHGSNKVFGKGGLDGTTRWFDSLGLKPPWVHARLAAATELGAGALVTLGVANPWPEAAVVGLMTAAAATDHRGKGFFIFKGGWEYTGVIAAAATALAALGHGRFSFDRLFGRHRAGTKWGLVAALVGVASAAGLLAASYKPEIKTPAGPEPAPEPAPTSSDGSGVAAEPSLAE